jgi:hypothetical protein
VRKTDNLPPSCADVKKSGGLNLLEPCGPVQACKGAVLQEGSGVRLETQLSWFCVYCGDSDYMFRPCSAIFRSQCRTQSRKNTSVCAQLFSPEYFLSQSSNRPHRTNTPPSVSLRQKRSSPTLHTYTHPPSTRPCTVKNHTGHT